MATLPAIRADVTRYFGSKPLWLTEYGYQTNPPDRLLGVSYALQAKYIGEAALRVWRQPGVTMLIHFLVRDEPSLGGWQSGLFSAAAARSSPTTRSRCRSRRCRGAGRARCSGARCGPAPGRAAYVLQRAVGGSLARSRPHGEDVAERRLHAARSTLARRRAGSALRARPSAGPSPAAHGSPRDSRRWTRLSGRCICSPRPCGSAARSRSSSSRCRRCSGSRARSAHARCARSASAGGRSAGGARGRDPHRRRCSQPARTRSTRPRRGSTGCSRSKARSSASSSPAPTSTTSCSARGSRARSAAGEPQSLRPILTAIGRANLARHGCAPDSRRAPLRVSPRLSPEKNGVAVPDDFDLAALIALRRARQRRRRPRRRRLLLVVFAAGVVDRRRACSPAQPSRGARSSSTPAT